jgi:hypothetical protein
MSRKPQLIQKSELKHTEFADFTPKTLNWLRLKTTKQKEKYHKKDISHLKSKHRPTQIVRLGNFKTFFHDFCTAFVCVSEIFNYKL